jgi:FkbM family methyltransferase
MPPTRERGANGSGQFRLDLDYSHLYYPQEDRAGTNPGELTSDYRRVSRTLRALVSVMAEGPARSGLLKEPNHDEAKPQAAGHCRKALVAPARVLRHARTRVGTHLDRWVPATAARIRAHVGGSRETEMLVLARFIRRDDVVIDAGAHRGLYTWLLARLVGRSGCVIAIEPQPALATYLRRAFARQPQVVVVQKGLSNHQGTALLTVPQDQGHEAIGHATLEVSKGRSMRIETTTVDHLDVKPSFIKADVEDHEFHLISGSRHTIEEHHPVLLLEIQRNRPGRDESRASRDESRMRLVNLLNELGYRSHYVDQSGALHSFDIHRLTDPSDSICEDRWVYNFIFSTLRLGSSSN